jgi:hypothetical protein
VPEIAKESIVPAVVHLRCLCVKYNEIDQQSSTIASNKVRTKVISSSLVIIRSGLCVISSSLVIIRSGLCVIFSGQVIVVSGIVIVRISLSGVISLVITCGLAFFILLILVFVPLVLQEQSTGYSSTAAKKCRSEAETRLLRRRLRWRYLLGGRWLILLRGRITGIGWRRPRW